MLVEGPHSTPFDEDAPKGFLPCEGYGAIVIRRLSDAEKAGNRILCTILAALAAAGGGLRVGAGLQKAGGPGTEDPEVLGLESRSGVENWGPKVSRRGGGTQCACF